MEDWQRQPVRVFYLHYEETMQLTCLRLVGKKLLGFACHGGQVLSGTSSGTPRGRRHADRDGARTRPENRVGESADLVWRQRD